MRKAAEQGHAVAQYSLGSMYSQGKGVAQDYQQAYAWFSVATANGFPSVSAVQMARDDIASKLTSTELAEAQELACRYFGHCA
jgi:TPR repeat protein